MESRDYHQEEKWRSLSKWFKANFNKVETDLVDVGGAVKKVAQEDPRRIVHSIKVGLAIALVSLFYYFDPLYEGFGINAIWAVLTVVVVFEFSVGATLTKGANRVIATILGGMAGVGAHKLASMSGEDLEPALLGISVLIIAAVVTFMRFFPELKARYDYGLAIFILTFSLICVSAYREDEVLDMAQRRVTTILIGSSTAMIMCVLICPVWAGSDLHNLVASHIDKLADFFQGLEVEYFKNAADATLKDLKQASLDGFKSVLDSKSNIDSLVNFAISEPRHGQFRYRHPWTQYQIIGELTRRCACRAETLHSYLHSNIQAPQEEKAKFQDVCMKMSRELGKALKELSMAISYINQPSKAKIHIENAKQASAELNALLKSSTWRNFDLSEVLPIITVASLLTDVVACTEEIEIAVQELATLAKFKNVVVDYENNEPEFGNSNKFVEVHGQNTRGCFTNHVVTIEGSMSSASSSSPGRLISEDLSSLAMAQHVTE